MGVWKQKKEEEPYLTNRGAGVKYFTKLRKAAKLEKMREKKPKTITSVLEDFVNRSKDKTKRLELLRHVATVVLKEVSINELIKKRKEFDDFKNELFPLEAVWCWVCNKQLATLRHHVILLKHGGPPLAKDNVVCLCQTCHSAIHPWLSLTSVNQLEVTRIIEVISKVREGIFTRTQADIELSMILDELFSEPLDK